MDASYIIIRPLVTEKGTFQANELNTYSFAVHTKASKHDVKAAIEKLYNVKVADVRTLVRKGKPKRTRTGYKTTGLSKRAIVKLAGDSKIELF
jgi:large subunit ribosomal protein L23